MSPLLFPNHRRATLRDVHQEPEALHRGEDQEQEVGQLRVHPRHHGVQQAGGWERVSSHENSTKFQA